MSHLRGHLTHQDENSSPPPRPIHPIFPLPDSPLSIPRSLTNCNRGEYLRITNLLTCFLISPACLLKNFCACLTCTSSPITEYATVAFLKSGETSTEVIVQRTVSDLYFLLKKPAISLLMSSLTRASRRLIKHQRLGAIFSVSKVSMKSPSSYLSKASNRIPHSKPALTSVTSSLKRLQCFNLPLCNHFPSSH